MKDRQRIPARAGIGGAIDAGMDGGMATVRLLARVLGLAALVPHSSPAATTPRTPGPHTATFAMPPRRSASFPLHIEETAAAARAQAVDRRATRLALAAWAAAVYLLYWLGYLGPR